MLLLVRRLCWILCCAACCIEGSSSYADEATRWTEVGYGISLVPPPNTLQFEDRVVRWVDPRGFSVSFEISRSDAPVGLQDLTNAAMVQLGFALATPRLLDENGEPTQKPPVAQTIGDRPAVKMYFLLDETDQAEWFKGNQQAAEGDEGLGQLFCGQAIVMLEPYASAVIKITSRIEAQTEGRTAFEAVLASLRVPLARELDAIREELVEKSDVWLQTVTPSDWFEAMPRDQWFRLVQHKKDIGHVRVRTTQDPSDLRRFNHQPPGTLMVIDRREYLDGQALDTRSVRFAAADDLSELWETKATLRVSPHGADAPARLQNAGQTQTLTWAETGVRGNQQVKRRDADGRLVDRNANIITVITEAPPPSDLARRVEAHERFVGQPADSGLRGRVQTNEWVAPQRSYLSQLQVWALGKMLPAEREAYCFSAYHPDSGQPGLRTVEVYPQPDGQLLVLDRPTSKLSPTRYYYDAQRNLIERVSPQGLRMIPTTPEELAKVWKIESE